MEIISSGEEEKRLEYLEKVAKALEEQEKIDEPREKEKLLSMIKKMGGAAKYQELVEAEMQRIEGKTEQDRAQAIRNIREKFEEEHPQEEVPEELLLERPVQPKPEEKTFTAEELAQALEEARAKKIEEINKLYGTEETNL